MQKIAIGRHFISIDDDDYARVSNERWVCSRENPLTFQAWITVDGRRTKMSLARFILAPTDGLLVAHRPGFSRNDFRKCALTACTMAERQSTLRKSRVRASSKYKGVSRVRATDRWRASIRPRGKSIYLGEFDSEIEAARAYNRAAFFYFGPSAFQNDVGDEPVGQDDRGDQCDRAASNEQKAAG